MAHRTVSRAAQVEESVKGSRFLGYARAVSSSAEFEQWLQAIRTEQPDATHHCWAYRIDSEMRFSDDGEPGGTAGRPMLEVVLKRELDHLGVVVVRYFGGTRLGAGGLVRAYSGAVAKVLDAAGELLVEDRESFSLHAPFALIEPVRRLLAETREARTLEGEFDTAGWRVRLELPLAEAEGFRERLADLTRGLVQVRED